MWPPRLPAGMALALGFRCTGLHPSGGFLANRRRRQRGDHDHLFHNLFHNFLDYRYFFNYLFDDLFFHDHRFGGSAAAGHGNHQEQYYRGE